MFDSLIDLLGSMDDGSTLQSFGDDNSLIGSTQFQGPDLANHFDQTGAYAGNSQALGNNIFHHDATGAVTGHDNMLGNNLFHHDATGAVTGFDNQIGNNIFHHDMTGAITGFDSQVGNSIFHHDATGAVTGHTNVVGGGNDSISQIANNFNNVFKPRS